MILLRFAFGLALSYAILWGPQMLANPATLPVSIINATDAVTRLLGGERIGASLWLSIIRVLAVFAVMGWVLWPRRQADKE